MKTLIININNEQIQSNEDLEVLPHRLDIDLLYYLGEEIADGCRIKDETRLVTDFRMSGYEEYKKIAEQLDELKEILFSSKYDGKYEFRLPKGYIDWLNYHPEYNSVYNKNFSHDGSNVISVDLEDLYENSVENLQREILNKLRVDDFYKEVDEIVFNDDAVTRKSPIVRTIKDKYEGVGFKAYKKWLQDNEDRRPHTTPKVCEKCGKNPCECNTKPISSDNFFPYQGFTLGETTMKEFEDDLFDDGSIIHYDLDNGVTLLGATEGDTFIAAMVDSTKSSNNKLPKEWSNLLGCRFGASHEKCRRALSEKDFDIILDSDADIFVLSPNNKYRIHLFFDVNTSKFVAFLITLNECPYCNSKNFTFFVKPNTEIHMSCCVDCCRSYLPFEVESEELDEAEDEETLSCPNCSSDDVDDDGSDYLQYTCNDCGHNWGHDDTVECPECGSDDVENDGTDNMQYKCNACGEIWGDCEDDEVYDNDDEEDYDEDTDSAGNQMSEYYEAFGFVVGKSTKYDIQRQGGVLVPDSDYGEHQMPNGIEVYFFNNSHTVNHITIREKASNSIPYFYKNLGIYWGINKIEFRRIFENLGFEVREYKDECTDDISAYKDCVKFNTCITVRISYYMFGMFSFDVS